MSKEITNVGEAFVAEASLRMWGGSTGLSEAAALTDVLGAFNTTVRTTINSGIKDIVFYETVGMHAPSPEGSLINWHNLQVPWGEYGAPQGAAANYAQAFKTAIQAMCNFFSAAQSNASSSRGRSRIDAGLSGLGTGKGFGGYDPFLRFKTLCYWSQAYNSKGEPIGGPQFDGCITTLAG